jgi:hypothetical protein
MNLKPLAKPGFRFQRSSRQYGLVSFRNSPHLIVRVPQPVERNIDVQLEFGLASRHRSAIWRSVPASVHSSKVDMPHTVILNEQIDDFFQLRTQWGSPPLNTGP